MPKMTLEELKELPKETITPQEAAAVMGCAPYYINKKGKNDPNGLGFPVYFSGNRRKIPKRAFIKFMEGEIKCTSNVPKP